MGDRTGLSRADRNRNVRLARMRQLLPQQNAIVGIDLAGGKQAAVVTGHDWRVIGRRRVTARAWELGELLDWAVCRAVAAGFGSVTVACEPAGHRWRVLDQVAARVRTLGRMTATLEEYLQKGTPRSAPLVALRSGRLLRDANDR